MNFTRMFPLELEDRIIDLLAEDNDAVSSSALKACSHACQAFLPLCRKHIFASIVLNYPYSSPPSPTTQTLERLLSERPEIANYIRKLDYNIHVADLTSPSIFDSLKRISRLESLVVRHFGREKFDWSNNPIRPTLLHLLHLPTLSHFKVSAVTSFVISDLIPCINLKHLVIDNHTCVVTETTFPADLPKHPIQPNEFTAGTRTAMAICTARRSDGQSLVDFRSLTKITVVVDEPDESEALQELFGRCKNLTDIKIFFSDPGIVRPSLANILQPLMQTLKHIVVNFQIDDSNDDPLFGISSEFEDMRSKNVIESITIGVLVNTDDGFRRVNEWGKLDEVLTSSGWFALKQVSLTIKLDGCGWRDDALVVALRNLPETQFPRLSTSKSVSFDFEVSIVGPCR